MKIFRKIKEYYFYNNSIGQRIFMAMFVLLILTIVGFFLSTYVIMSFQFKHRTQESTKKDLTIISEKMDMFFERVENDTVKILASDSCQSLLKSGDFLNDDSRIQYQLYILMNKTIQGVFNSDEVYRLINFYDLKGNAYTSDSSKTDPALENIHRYKILDFINKEKNDDWISIHNSPWVLKSSPNKSNCLSYLRKVYSGESGELIGIIEMEINISSVFDLYKSICINGTNIYIIDNNETLVSSNIPSEISNSFSEVKWYNSLKNNKSDFYTNDADFIYGQKDYRNMGWKIILSIPKELYSRDLLAFTIAYFFICVLLLICISLLSRKLILSITEPLSSITKTIHYIGKGDLEKRVNISTGGEIGLLATEFNKMLDHTNILMKQIVETEEKKREFELSLIQMQMIPHFFYNILESICGLIVIEDKKLAIRTIQLLSRFYRNVLNKGKEIIDIKYELEIAENYLGIMQICYPHMITYEMVIDNNLLGYKINKLTLQPLLENAVYHGIVANGKRGHIKVELSEKNKKIHLSVKDDGQGIHPDMVGKIMSDENSEMRLESFGLKNTDNRIKLYFGEEYGIKIKNRTNNGANVTVVLPMQKDKSG